MIRRREFITLIGGMAAWPIAARAQQQGRVRRIGVLMNLAADDPEGQLRLAAFLQGLQEAMRRSTFAGVRATRSKCANRWPRWSRSPRT
jgi:hypothetical protein